MLNIVRRTWATARGSRSIKEKDTLSRSNGLGGLRRIACRGRIFFMADLLCFSLPFRSFIKTLRFSEVNMRRTIIALGLIAALVAATGCTKRGSSTADPGGDIKVGVYGDLTGQTSSFGQSTKNGAQMAADEINAAGGINGRKIQVVIEDDQGEPGKAATVVAKLINQDQVRALIGEVASSNSIAAAPNAQEAKIPMISPSSTNPKVTQIGDYIFRVCFIDPFQGEVMAKFAANTLKAKKAAILFDSNSDYSKGLIQFFKQSFVDKLGGQIVAEQAYAQRDRDFTRQSTQ